MLSLLRGHKPHGMAIKKKKVYFNYSMHLSFLLSLGLEDPFMRISAHLVFAKESHREVIFWAWDLICVAISHSVH